MLNVMTSQIYKTVLEKCNYKSLFCMVLLKAVAVSIASAESRSVRRASHQSIFMGDCLTICHTYLPCLPREWISFCVSGTAEVRADAAWM